MNKIDLKRKLLLLCEEYANNKIQIAEDAIESAQASANEESKSTAGDKYETGRSMIQLEIEKYSSQLADGINLKKALSQIVFTKIYTSVNPGSLVFTNNGNFFISISAGKLNVDEVDFIAISLSSPIGQELFNKEVNDEINFRGKVYKILDVT